MMFIDSKMQVMVTSLWDKKYLEYISRIRIMNNNQTAIEQLSNNNGMRNNDFEQC
jgi:hypothetical protein